MTSRPVALRLPGLRLRHTTMKIVIAPDSYKESLSATEVAQAIEKGFREIFPDAHYVSVPVADGGEGTVEAMIAATQGTGSRLSSPAR